MREGERAVRALRVGGVVVLVLRRERQSYAQPTPPLLIRVLGCVAPTAAVCRVPV